MTTIRRTIETYLNNRCKEGPIDTGGARVVSVSARAALHLGSAAWSTGVIEMRGMAGSRATPRAYTAAQSISSATPFIRDAGEPGTGKVGGLGDSFIDFICTTAEAGVVLELEITLAGAPSGVSAST
jgi:hypothetical protein